MEAQHKTEEYGSGSAGGARAKTSQKEKGRDRPSKIKVKGEPDRHAREVAFDATPADESAFRSSAYKSGGGKWGKPLATEPQHGPKPYELWK